MKDALYWAEKIRNKELSLKEYCTELDKKVQKANPDLNALVEWNFPQLLQDVETFRPQTNQPFAGLPIPLKMLAGQEKAGWKSTMGSRLFSNNRAAQTANFVKKLEQAGFIPAGQTNSPEFGFKNITDAEIYGPARNPWNLDHSPGGSSGGAAAVVASGLFPIAGASDGGGSIRIPASFSGLIGLKPTRGAMPSGPDGWRGWQGAAINFALTISMRDTETLFYAIRGSEKAAPYQAPAEEWQQHNIKKRLKIAFLTESPVHSQVSDEAVTAVHDAVAQLTKLGHEVTEIEYPLDGIRLIRSYYLMNGAETSAMFDNIQRHRPEQLTLNDMELITWGLYQYGERVAVKDYIHALNLWDKAAAVMEELFNEYDLLLTPTTAQPAPEINEELQSDGIREGLRNAENLSDKEMEALIFQMFDKSLALSPFTQLANLTGQPAISLPTHVTKSGLPLGIQFMASKGREDLLFSIGEQMEAEQLFRLPEAYRG